MESYFVSRREMAQLLGIALPTLDRWVHDGLIPKPSKLGTRKVAWGRDRAMKIAAMLDKKGLQR